MNQENKQWAEMVRLYSVSLVHYIRSNWAEMKWKRIDYLPLIAWLWIKFAQYVLRSICVEIQSIQLVDTLDAMCIDG